MILESLWLKVATVIIAAAIGLAATYWFRMKPDNPIEQSAEKIILLNTGLDLDLSPEDEELELEPDLIDS